MKPMVVVVQTEVTRIGQVSITMGGVVRVTSVDPIGVLEIKYREPNRVNKGLEWALVGLEFVKHNKLTSASIEIDLLKGKEPPIEPTII